MSFIIYPHSLDSATIDYNRTHDSGYGEEMLNDRNKNFVFKDSAIGASTFNIDIDLGSGVTRYLDHIILGGYKFSTNSIGDYYLSYSDDDSSYTEITTDSFDEQTVATDLLITFTKTAAGHRYYRFAAEEVDSGNLTSFELGNFFCGEMITLSTSYNLDTTEGIAYDVISNQGAGGYRYGQIVNTSQRKNWTYNFEYLTSAEKTTIETFANTIYCSSGLSRYPFYFSPDSGTTLHFGRLVGEITFTQIAYQRYSCGFNIQQEL